LAKGGGVCMVINESCCAYRNQEKEIETDLNNMWKQTKILHQVAQDDDTSWGFNELWNKLTAWLPNFACLKQVLTFLILISILVLISCVVIQCSLRCCKQTTITYRDWKRKKIRHQVETGEYFSNH
ncbi:ERVV2 protein, partial [Atlantisia rogersi]|nr:ERVV2 protein [Atlantisia rogersi]